MSLKAFHIFFLTVSLVASLFIGFWSLREWRESGEGVYLGLGLLSFATLIAIIPYGIWFLRKLKNVSYL